MSMQAEMDGRHARVLGELAELGLEMARGLKVRALGADDAGVEPSIETLQGLTLAFQRAARAVRMTLALEVRLLRERRLAWREALSDVEHEAQLRKAQVRRAVGAVIDADYEGEAAERLHEALNDRIETEALYDRFVEGPVEVQIAAIRADLGLPANDAGSDALAAWRPGPPPPDAGAPDLSPLPTNDPDAVVPRPVTAPDPPPDRLGRA